MTRGKSIMAAIGFGMVTLFGATGCGLSNSTISWQADGMPYHVNKNQEWWHYQYVYHPTHQVYYEPYTKMYYWFENETWWECESLPEGYSLDGSYAKVVKVETQTPPFHHQKALAEGGPTYGGYDGIPEPVVTGAMLTSGAPPQFSDYDF